MFLSTRISNNQRYNTPNNHISTTPTLFRLFTIFFNPTNTTNLNLCRGLQKNKKTRNNGKSIRGTSGFFTFIFDSGKAPYGTVCV